MFNGSPAERLRCLLLSILLLISFAVIAGANISVYQQKNDRAGQVAVDTLKQVSDSSGQLSDSVQGGLKTGMDTVQQLPDSVVYKQQEFTKEELIRGERLFYGLVYSSNETVDCEYCHNTRIRDTLNWNPDGIQISVKYQDKSAIELSRVLLKPAGKKMSEVHKAFNLSATDIVLLKAYMDELAQTELVKPKPIVTNLLILIIASVIFLGSVVDLVLKRLFKRAAINWLILTVTGVVITWILAVNAIAFGRAEGFSPAQPIKFSHAVHAGQNKTDCNYCHHSAKNSKTAGIPASGVCWNCHFLVRNGTKSGAWEISKIVQAIETNDPVDWVRIYKLPDFVFFNHSQHVVAGDIDCGACHGDVTVDDRLSQEADLSMGWCLDCHESRKVNLQGKYYQTHFPEKYLDLQEGRIDSLLVKDSGGWDCGRCHY